MNRGGGRGRLGWHTRTTGELNINPLLHSTPAPSCGELHNEILLADDDLLLTSHSEGQVTGGPAKSWSNAADDEDQPVSFEWKAPVPARPRYAGALLLSAGILPTHHPPLLPLQGGLEGGQTAHLAPVWAAHPLPENILGLCRLIVFLAFLQLFQELANIMSVQCVRRGLPGYRRALGRNAPRTRSSAEQSGS